MSVQKVLLTAAEERRSIDQFCGSVYQVRIHNFLVDRIAELQLKLESANRETFSDFQGQIRECKILLHYIHKDDSPATKEIYETKPNIVTKS